MTAAQRLREQGRAEGRAEARLEGRIEGKAEVLSLWLQQRFGELPEHVSERLFGASSEQLDAWVERVLTAASLDAFFE